MRKILKNRALVLTIVGMAIMAQSALWEYVRVEPTYRFIVEPWSLRGYEVTQGLVIAAMSLGIAVFAVLVVRGVIKETIGSAAIGVTISLAYAVAVAILADARPVKMPFIVHILLSIVAAVVGVALLERFIPKLWKQRRRLARSGIWLVSFLVILFGVVGPLLQNERPFWVFILLAGVIVGALALFRPPTELAGLRWVINSIVAVWVMSMTMSAGLRQALQGAQLEVGEASAQLRELQVTSGVLLAWFGGLVAFTGAVGMWAKRRDQIIAHERARKQQEAAQESERQLTA